MCDHALSRSQTLNPNDFASNLEGHNLRRGHRLPCQNIRNDDHCLKPHKMSTYNGRRAPNVSRYLQDLNAISPENTTANEENFNVDDQLSFFTNTEFFDLDSGQNTDFQAPPTKPDVVATPAPSSTEDPTSVMGDISNMDFMNGETRLSSMSC